VSWQNAKQISDAWCEANLPNSSCPADLQGRYVQLATFVTDADCRFFYADRDGGYHRMITTGIARTVRKRKGEVVYIEVLPTEYFGWLAGGGEDTPHMRAAFIEHRSRLLL
jgi:hypothetical protein